MQCQEKNNPLVSVIICSYNYAHFLPRALDSLIHQTLEDIEIIVVDDASTDNTSDIVRDYQASDARIQYVRNSNNLKLFDSRIVGMENAKGDYVTFCDADDLHELDSLEKLYLTAIKERVDIVTANVVFNEHNSKVKFAPAGVFNEALSSVNNPYSSVCTSLFSRIIVEKALNDYPRNLALLHAEDWLHKFFLYFHAKKRVHIVDGIYHWRINSGSISQAPSLDSCIRRINDHTRVINQVKTFMENNQNHDGLPGVYRCYLNDLSLSAFNKLTLAAPENYAGIWEREAPSFMKEAITHALQQKIVQLKNDKKKRTIKGIVARWRKNGFK